MAGLLDYYSDATCNTHNALRNIPYDTYACGVSFRFTAPGNDAASLFADTGYGVASLRECCARANATLMRIPGNTGCEMQYCEVPEATSTRSFDVHGLVTKTLAGGSHTVEYTDPTPSTETIVEAPQRISNCMASVYERDLPEDVAEGVLDAGNWCVVRMYDDALPDDEVRAAETASLAPPAWTEAAKDPLDDLLASQSATGADGARETGEGGGEGAAARTGGYGWASRMSLCGAFLVASGLILW